MISLKETLGEIFDSSSYPQKCNSIIALSMEETQQSLPSLLPTGCKKMQTAQVLVLGSIEDEPK